MMKKNKSIVTINAFDFAGFANETIDQDITEWFSDNDIYLAEIISDHDLGAFSVNLSL